MSIQSEITRITNKRDLALSAVAAKGVTVPAGSTIDDLPDLISMIQQTGVSVVTTQDSHGGDIVTITAEPIVPWSPWGEEAVLLSTYDMGTVALKDTAFNTWTPSTTAKTIQATSNLGTISSPALDTYEYAIKTVFESNTAYASGTTLKAAVVRQIIEMVQICQRKPSALANMGAKTDNYNYCATFYTAPWMEYYNTSGTHSMAWTGSYGFYPTATAATFSSNTSTNATITIKAPAYTARCYKSYLTEAMAAAVDKTNSTIKCKVYVYRYKKAGSMMYQMYDEIVDLYNA